MTNQSTPSLWGAIHTTIRAGQDPVVWIAYSMLVVPERKKPGRKRVERVEPDTKAYARAVLGGQAKPRCLNPHCRSTLKAGADRARQVCGEGCRVGALAAYQAVVALLSDGEEQSDVGVATEDAARRAYLGTRVEARRRTLRRKSPRAE